MPLGIEKKKRGGNKKTNNDNRVAAAHFVLARRVNTVADVMPQSITIYVLCSR